MLFRNILITSVAGLMGVQTTPRFMDKLWSSRSWRENDA